MMFRNKTIVLFPNSKFISNFQRCESKLLWSFNSQTQRYKRQRNNKVNIMSWKVRIIYKLCKSFHNNIYTPVFIWWINKDSVLKYKITNESPLSIFNYFKLIIFTYNQVISEKLFWLLKSFFRTLSLILFDVEYNYDINIPQRCYVHVFNL